MSTDQETAADHIAWLREFAAWDEPHDEEQRAEADRRLDEIARAFARAHGANPHTNAAFMFGREQADRLFPDLAT